MPVNKPVTRSQQLIPLSHDHHEGLLFAWRIRQGLQRNVSLKTICEFINWFWKDRLQQHFHDEEISFVPYLPRNDELMTKMIAEHEAIQKLLPGTSLRTQSEIALFAQLLHDHIRFEERELFPYIENKLTQSELNELASNLNHASRCSVKWENEFWKY